MLVSLAGSTRENQPANRTFNRIHRLSISSSDIFLPLTATESTSKMIAPGSLAAGVTALLLFSIGLIAIVLTSVSRRRQHRQEEKAEEGSQSSQMSVVISSTPPQLPMFKTRSSLSMSSQYTSASSPATPKSPGIRFTFTSPSHRSRKSESIDSLPNVEIVLEQYELEADAADRFRLDEKANTTMSDQVIGEPGPAISSEESLIEKDVEEGNATGRS